MYMIKATSKNSAANAIHGDVDSAQTENAVASNAATTTVDMFPTIPGPSLKLPKSWLALCTKDSIDSCELFGAPFMVLVYCAALL